jgi:Restriction endonuclease BglII
MKTVTYSHNFGEFAIPIEILQPTKLMLERMTFVFELNCARQFREKVLNGLQEQGWSGEAKIDIEKGLTITSMNKGIGLCLQTGNMGRFYADLLKLQCLYLRDKASASIYLLPTKKAASEMGSNVANFDRFVEELQLYKHIITIPIFVIGIEGDD